MTRDPRVVRQDLLLLANSLVDDHATLFRRLPNHPVDVGVEPLNPRVLRTWAGHVMVEVTLHLGRYNWGGLRVTGGALLRLGSVGELGLSVEPQPALTLKFVGWDDLNPPWGA